MAQAYKAGFRELSRHKVDDKGRLTIPSEWRHAHAAEDTFLATPHPDGYIAVLPPAEVDKLHDKISAMKLSDAAAQAFSARFFSQTQGVSFDKAGRVGLTLPPFAQAGSWVEMVGRMIDMASYGGYPIAPTGSRILLSPRSGSSRLEVAFS